jgi:hypothetical protein
VTPVIYLDGGIGFGAAGERQGIVIGEAVTSRAAVASSMRAIAGVTGAAWCRWMTIEDALEAARGIAGDHRWRARSGCVRRW